jgi:D-amino peptidase
MELFKQERNKKAKKLDESPKPVELSADAEEVSMDDPDIQNIIKEYDVCMMIGQHAMAGTQLGCMNHTQSSSSVDYYMLNGKLIGEIAQFALQKGALGLPLIFLSGDDIACKEVTDLLPEITTVSVKLG